MNVPFDPIRRIQSLEASAKLSNIIARLFQFRDAYRPVDLLALLDRIDAAIADQIARTDSHRKLNKWRA